MHYFLANHAFVCGIGPDIIILDLRRHQYVIFERDYWEPIARNIGGWPESIASRIKGLTPDKNVLAQLLESELLTEDGDRGKDAAPASTQLPSTALIEDFDITPPTIRIGHVFAFLGSVLFALVNSRLMSVEHIVARARRIQQRATSYRIPDVATLRELTEIFRRLRPFLFASRGNSLFESLALLHFLSRYRIHPTWVFGVRNAPFETHCWLQFGKIACNDPLDRIRRYTPIMRV